MVTITVNRDDLAKLVRRKLPQDLDELTEILSYLKSEASHPGKSLQEGAGELELNIEQKETNRPDLWSTEGIARGLRGILGVESGLAKYRVHFNSGVQIYVDKRLREIRPFIACVIAKGLTLNDTIIRSLVQLQEKLDSTYGRKRRRSSIGLYDYDLIKPPIHYGVSAPDETSFVPLDSSDPMSLREILEKHPKGVEYGHIVRDHKVWPILLDSNKNVLSFPPIINSIDLGRITDKTRNILVEVTGTAEDAVNSAVTILSAAMMDRGAKIGSTTIHYSYGKARRVVTPLLRYQQRRIRRDSFTEVLGMELDPKTLVRLLRRMRLDASATRNELKVTIPPYRLDVMHDMDVIEDAAIAYDLNKMKPRWPPQLTIGGTSSEDQFSDIVRELMVGLGFQEVLTYTMTTPEILFDRMNTKPTDYVEVSNPKVQTMTCLRNWLLPSLMEVLSENTHVPYPQALFEVGACVLPDKEELTMGRDNRKLAAVIAHAQANFTEVKARLDPLLTNLGIRGEIEETEHPAFISGRAGRIRVNDTPLGTVGEIHPKVLENWKMENPVAAFEIDVDLIQAERAKPSK
jgi:phenylalanyl-tRNA synthetase beta chain